MNEAELEALQKLLVKRLYALPEPTANAIAGNYLPELLTFAPEPVLRSVAIAIGNAEDLVEVDAGRMSYRDAYERQRAREAPLREGIG